MALWTEKSEAEQNGICIAFARNAQTSPMTVRKATENSWVSSCLSQGSSGRETNAIFITTTTATTLSLDTGAFKRKND